MPKPILPIWKMRLGQAIAFSPDSKSIAAAGASGPARVFDSQTGKERLTCEGPKANIHQLAFSPDGSRIAIGPINDRIALCDASTGILIEDNRAKAGLINNLAFNSATGHLIRASRKNVVDVFGPGGLANLKEFCPATNAFTVNCAAFYPDGSSLLAAWSPISGEQKLGVECFGWPSRGLRWSARLDVELAFDCSVSVGGKYVAVAFSSYRPVTTGVVVIDGDSGKPVRTILTNKIPSVAFHPTEQILVVSDIEGERDYCRMLNPRTGGEVRRIDVGQMVFSLAISPDGRLLVAASFGGVIVWDWPSLS